jgi:hypothetical protein
VIAASLSGEDVGSGCREQVVVGQTGHRQQVPHGRLLGLKDIIANGRTGLGSWS